jgi:predicted N-acetyltransferase YhbS
MAPGNRHGIDVRTAAPADAADIAALLGQLGYPMDARESALRLEQAARQPAGTLLVATGETGAVVGLIALHWCFMVQQPRPVARITTMVVDDRERRRGIGRLLMKAGAQSARAAGCDVLELTTGLQRAEAHAFYRSLGFVETSLRFSRSLRRQTG